MKKTGGKRRKKTEKIEAKVNLWGSGGLCEMDIRDI